jgi:hypothetical protein
MTDQLFAAPFPRTWTPGDIRAFFEQVGPVKSVKRPRDHETGEYRKFVFVAMHSPELATAAVEKLNGMEVEGEPLSVRYAENPIASKARSKLGESRPRSASQPPAVPELVWDQRQEALERVLAAPGPARTVKVTVVGQPGWVEPRGNLVMVGLTHSLKPTGYPKGVPAPPGTPTTYVVYIGAKQWKKVDEAIQNPEDLLVIEGQAMIDSDLSVIAVFATNVSTKLSQQANKPKPETLPETSEEVSGS